MLRESLVDELTTKLDALDCREALPVLLKHAVECVYIHNLQSPSSRIGESRIGGLPDLPGHIEWPKGESKDKPSARADFIAQFALADIPDFKGKQIPKSGHLWLFLKDYPSEGPYIPIEVIVDPSPDGVLSTRERPQCDEWIKERSLNPVSLGFRVGISLPFYSWTFQRELRNAVPDYPIKPDDLQFELNGEDNAGQIGGYSNSYNDENVAKVMAVQLLGRNDLPSSVLLYDSMLEFEADLRAVPDYVKTDENLAHWKRSFEELRPGVEWIDKHCDEVAAWKLLLKLESNIQADFDMGDSWPLWTFANSGELLQKRFDNVIACTGA